MLNISVPWLVDLVLLLEKVEKDIAEGVEQNIQSTLFGVLYNIELLSNEGIYTPYLKSSLAKAEAIYNMLSLKILVDEPVPLSATELQLIDKHIKDLNTILKAELHVAPIFLITPKGSFDLLRILDSSYELFPPTLRFKAPETEHDVTEVAKALIFDLPTACGFHTFRIVESVTRRYWDAVSDGDDRPKRATLGHLLKRLQEEKRGDDQIIGSLQQLTRLHRNPLAHPEHNLTTEEAIGTVGMARSVLAPMLEILDDEIDQDEPI